VVAAFPTSCLALMVGKRKSFTHSAVFELLLLQHSLRKEQLRGEWWMWTMPFIVGLKSEKKTPVCG